MSRPKKKIVLVLVEGKSERELLRDMISTLYDRIDEYIQVYFPIIREDDAETGGDITSRSGVTPKNIQREIYDLFLHRFFDQEKIMPKDVYEVIQIVDMDGVYIPDGDIHATEDPTLDHYYYAEDRIIVPGPDAVVKAQERNNRKRQNLEFLLSLDKIKVKQKSVKYSVYYFSCNLDHFFHRDANMNPEDKVYAAWDLSAAYLHMDDGVDKFVDFICRDPRSALGMTLEQSWEYIQEEGHNSLKSGTNINILLERLRGEAEAAT